ncbi:MAG: metallophosphoesterase [Ruminococcus flavefaciens]|nr:metallophosphoesterase [Ruminococcus flavefaciens]MCM1229847.1 metallophosphoesterase [Ruminococcus flavefaciens]
MIYVTGDVHGEYHDFMRRIHGAGVKRGSTVIICGDFGLVWNDEYHRYFLQILKSEPFDFLFVDGNHEDFDLLYSYPVEDWNGGKIHRISDNIMHLMRGQVFEIEGRKFFTMGGAYSIDKAMRREGISWWSAEIPTDEEYKTAGESLEKCGYSVDYVITHTIPKSAIHRLGRVPAENDGELTGYLEWLYSEKLDFKKWFAGHWHKNILVNDNLQILFDEVQEIE